MKLKAIETVYKGYRFRSRLEARWAVFFEEAGIEWEYEKEGYELPWEGQVIRYLPDFWLPTLDCFAEVKGTRLSGKDKIKMEALCAAANTPVLLFQKVADDWDFDFRMVVKQELSLVWDKGSLLACPSCKNIFLVGGQTINKEYRCPTEKCPGPWQYLDQIEDGISGTTQWHAWQMPWDSLWRAFEKARQARFEFGEEG